MKLTNWAALKSLVSGITGLYNVIDFGTHKYIVWFGCLMKKDGKATVEEKWMFPYFVYKME